MNEPVTLDRDGSAAVLLDIACQRHSPPSIPAESGSEWADENSPFTSVITYLKAVAVRPASREAQECSSSRREWGSKVPGPARRLYSSVESGRPHAKRESMMQLSRFARAPSDQRTELERRERANVNPAALLCEAKAFPVP